MGWRYIKDRNLDYLLYQSRLCEITSRSQTEYIGNDFEVVVLNF